MRLNLKASFRQDVYTAQRQLELEEMQREEISMREARRMLYRPPHYFKVPKRVQNLIIFLLTIGLVFACMWLAFAL